MAYLARRDIVFSGAIFHVSWQCHNLSWFLEDESAKQLYYNLLFKYKDRYGVSIYSYSFMDDHPHLTGRTETAEGLSRLMQAANSKFAKWVNKSKKRCGQVVMDRFVSTIVQTDRDLIKVMGYDDTNPSSAKKVAHPKDYKWSSYRHYAFGEPDPLITPAPSYLALGETDEERQREYRAMVDMIMAEDESMRRDYSKTLYIGDPDWVAARYREIREIAAAKRLAYLLRQRKLYRAMASP